MPYIEAPILDLFSDDGTNTIAARPCLARH